MSIASLFNSHVLESTENTWM